MQAKNLIAAGYKLTVWNRSLDKCKPLEELGAKVSTCHAPHLAVNLASLLVEGFGFTAFVLLALEPGEKTARSIRAT